MQQRFFCFCCILSFILLVSSTVTLHLQYLVNPPRMMYDRSGHMPFRAPEWIRTHSPYEDITEV